VGHTGTSSEKEEKDLEAAAKDLAHRRTKGQPELGRASKTADLNKGYWSRSLKIEVSRSQGGNLLRDFKNRPCEREK